MTDISQHQSHLLKRYEPPVAYGSVSSAFVFLSREATNCAAFSQREIFIGGQRAKTEIIRKNPSVIIV